MRTEQIITILEAIAAGIDPHTGETLPDKVFHSADVIRALFTAAQRLRMPTPNVPSTDGPPSRTEKPMAAGTRWTETEDAQLCSEFDAAVEIRDIATRHNRTRGAIMSRLVKLGRIDPGSVHVRDRMRRAS